MATKRNRKVKHGRQKSQGVRKPASRSTTLPSPPKPTESHEAALARLMVEGVGVNAVTVVAYSTSFGKLDLAECMAALTAETQRVQGGSMEGLEAILAAHVVTLNTMFTKLAYEASKMDIVDQIDRWTRLAFKAQSQCRAPAETLATIKNPATVFARQANIAHGPQQVNTAVLSSSSRDVPRARAGNQKIEQNELLEAHGERLDGGPAGPAGARDQAMAPLGTRDRPAHE